MTATTASNPAAVDDGVASPGLIIISNVPTPYRIHLHRRIAAEIPELGLYSYFTHSRADFNWEVRDAESIRPIWLAEDDGDTRSAGRVANWGTELRQGRRIVADIRSRDIRAVIVNGYNDLARLRVMRWCRRHDVPVFVRGDSNILGDRPGRRALVKRRLLNWVVRCCNGVMPMGRLGQEYFERYGADPARCFWVPYEPDYGFFGTVPADDLQAFRNEHRLAADRRVLVFSGRLVPVKRVDLLIDAFVQIATDRPAWDLAIAGDGPLREDLAARVPEELRSRVRWLGFLGVDDMRLAYHAADALVLPSDYEPWALVVNEAMAAGCPVVASAVVGAAAELIEDGVSGRVFVSGDRAALAGAILDVTGAEHERYREAVGPALDAWRRRADPVAGIRAALRSVGVLRS